MAEVTIDSSGRYVPRRRHDQTKSQPEAIPVEERNLPAGDVAVPEVSERAEVRAARAAYDDKIKEKKT